MTVRVSTDLPIAAERACALAQDPAWFNRIVWPIFHIRDPPGGFELGEEISARLWWFGFLPGNVHHIRVIEATPTMLFTNEHGGPVRRWNHRLTFVPTSAGSCRYTDEVEIGAGIFTPLVVGFAHLMYRWRQRRWRRLTKT